MNSRLKVKEAEEKAKIIFGGNFIGLFEACAVLGRNLKEKELNSFASFSLNEEELKRYAAENFILLTVPVRMTVEEIFAVAPKLFIFNLSDREIISLKKEIIKPGRYLVKKEPKRLSFNGLMMREMGMRPDENPKLAEAMYVYALTYLAGKRRMLIEKICILCREEVERRFGKTHLCFQKDVDTAIKIGAWPSQIPNPSIFPIKRA